MRIEDVNDKIRELNVGSYSLIVDRSKNKIVVNSDRGFDNFTFMNFEVVSTKENWSNVEEISEDISDELEEFDMSMDVPDMEADFFKE